MASRCYVNSPSYCNKMAEEISKRNRKANFTVTESNVILEEAEKNMAVIKCKFSSVITNKKKNEVWSEITKKVNSLGVCERTVTEVKDKWRAMVSNAKKEHCNLKKSKKITGGGPASQSPSASSTKIIDLFGDDPSFSGIVGGVDTSLPLTADDPVVVTQAAFDHSISTIDLSELELTQNVSLTVADPLITEDNPPKKVKMESGTLKKRRVSTEDINAAHFEVIALEKEKLQKEIINLDLKKEILLLEMEEIRMRMNK